MNFLADEGIDRQIVDRLRAGGHEVYYAAESAPATPDDHLLQYANEHHAIVVTSDKDFGELIYRMGRAHAGVILLRVAGLSADAKCDHVLTVLRERAAEIPGAFTVITPGAVRIRRVT